MLAPLHRRVSGLGPKIGVTLLVLIFALGAYAGWLAARDPADFDARRLEQLRTLSGEQKALRKALSGVNRRIADLQAELAVQQDRLHLAERAAANLRAGDRWWRSAWDRLFGDWEEVRTQTERLARFERTRSDAATRSTIVRATITRATWERDGLEIALGRLEGRLGEVERERSKTMHYLGRAWRTVRWYALAALAAWLFVPVLWRRWQGRLPG